MNISKIITFWEFRGRLFEAIGRRGAAMGRPEGYGRLAIGRCAMGAEHPREHKYAALALATKIYKNLVVIFCLCI